MGLSVMQVIADRIVAAGRIVILLALAIMEILAVVVRMVHRNYKPLVVVLVLGCCNNRSTSNNCTERKNSNTSNEKSLILIKEISVVLVRRVLLIRPVRMMAKIMITVVRVARN